MMLTLDALTAAARLHLSPSLAGSLRPALAALRGRAVEASEPVEEAEVGEILLRAVLGLPKGAGEVPLHSVHLVLPSETVTLTPDDALTHPLLTGWTASTLAEAFSAPVVAGARATRLAAQAPSFGMVQSVETDAGLAGRAILTFSVDGVAISAIAAYGNDTLPDFTRTNTLTGVALCKVGREARLTPAVEPREEAEEAWPAAASGALH